MRLIVQTLDGVQIWCQQRWFLGSDATGATVRNYLVKGCQQRWFLGSDATCRPRITVYGPVACQQRWFLGSDATTPCASRGCCICRANSVGFSEAMRPCSMEKKQALVSVPTALVSRKRCDGRVGNPSAIESVVPTALVSRKRCDADRHGHAKASGGANSVGFSEAMRQLHYSHRYDQVFCCLLRAREAYSGIYCLMCGNNGITPN